MNYKRKRTKCLETTDLFSNENEQIRYFCNNKNDTNNDSTNNNSNTDDYVDDGNDDKVHDDNNKDDNKIITKIITLLTKNSKTSKDQFYVDNFGLSIIRIDGKFIFFLLPWRDSLINVPGSMLLCSEQSSVSA